MGQHRSGAPKQTTHIVNTVADALNQAKLSRFHLRAMFVAGMGFFTAVYDLFIIGTAWVLIKDEWHLSGTAIGLIGSSSLIVTFAFSMVGLLITLLFIREPAGLSLEEASREEEPAPRASLSSPSSSS